MQTDSGAPYMIERTLSAHGGGYGRGFIVTHRPTQIGALRPTLESAVEWMDSDARYRRARDERDRTLEAVGIAQRSGLDTLRRAAVVLEAEFAAVGL